MYHYLDCEFVVFAYIQYHLFVFIILHFINVSSCKLLIGIEVFYKEDEDVIKKAPDYSLDLSNIYYTSLIKGDDNKYVIPDYVESQNHKEDFEYLLNILKLEKKQ